MPANRKKDRSGVNYPKRRKRKHSGQYSSTKKRRAASPERNEHVVIDSQVQVYVQDDEPATKETSQVIFSSSNNNYSPAYKLAYIIYVMGIDPLLVLPFNSNVILNDTLCMHSQAHVHAHTCACHNTDVELW